MGGRKRTGRGREPRTRSVALSLREYGRGLAGGLLFSLPLLYTMEVWWMGFIASPLRLLVYVSATFVLLLGYNRYAGLRRDASFREVMIDSVEEMGIGILFAALILWLLGRVTLEQHHSEIVGRIVVEAMTVAVGVSVGTAQLGGDEDEEVGMQGDGDEGEDDSVEISGGEEDGSDQGESGAGGGRTHITFGGQIVLAFCGAVLFAANVAPTEEIVMIATEISPLRAVGLALFSLSIGAVVLFFSSFRGSERFAPVSDRWSIVIGTVVTYAIALVASALILWFFGRFEGQAVIVCVMQTVVLGVAGSLGASAGRLLLQ